MNPQIDRQLSKKIRTLIAEVEVALIILKSVVLMSLVFKNKDLKMTKSINNYIVFLVYEATYVLQTLLLRFVNKRYLLFWNFNKIGLIMVSFIMLMVHWSIKQPFNTYFYLITVEYLSILIYIFVKICIELNILALTLGYGVNNISMNTFFLIYDNTFMSMCFKFDIFSKNDDNQPLLESKKFSDFNTKIKDDYDICSICIEKFEDDDEIYQLKCKHIFHIECINAWFRQKQNCPNCKESV